MFQSSLRGEPRPWDEPEITKKNQDTLLFSDRDAYFFLSASCVWEGVMTESEAGQGIVANTVVDHEICQYKNVSYVCIFQHTWAVLIGMLFQR